ncbi:MAG: beta-galactosidase [Bowdeniella nasicola]|nr:beta-galactosidase [Bowdeniella nasicola]
MVDGKRLNIWSGVIHYWRLPDVNGWRDMFQKMRANGYAAVDFDYSAWISAKDTSAANPFKQGPGSG